MLPGLTVPASLAVLLQAFRSCFRLRPFEVFCLLAVGMITQTGACTVTGMLVGAGMQTVVAHDRVHRFFSTHAWSADQLGLVVAGLMTRAFPDRAIHLVADAAYHGKPLQDLPARVTWTTRIQRNGVLYQPAPPPTGKRGRPRT